MNVQLIVRHNIKYCVFVPHLVCWFLVTNASVISVCCLQILLGIKCILYHFINCSYAHFKTDFTCFIILYYYYIGVH